MLFRSEHYKHCLVRLVSHYNPTLRNVITEMEASQLATFLASLTIPDSSYEQIETEIDNLVRPPKTKLRTIMASLLALAEARYKEKPAEERKALLEKQMRTGILNFTEGEVRKEVTAAIDACGREKIEINWRELLEGAERAELIHGAPTSTLKFSSAMPQTILTFNVNTKINNKPETGIRTKPNAGVDRKATQSLDKRERKKIGRAHV